MTLELLIQSLEDNMSIFNSLFNKVDKQSIHWAAEGKWSPLIIACHLVDEEVEDFRLRFKMTLEDNTQDWPPFDQVAWVIERKYKDQNFALKVSSWQTERMASLSWLKTLKAIDWSRTYKHPNHGDFSLSRIAANWIAHDYLHIKQLTRAHYDYLIYTQKFDMNYAGTWT